LLLLGAEVEPEPRAAGTAGVFADPEPAAAEPGAGTGAGVAASIAGASIAASTGAEAEPTADPEPLGEPDPEPEPEPDFELEHAVIVESANTTASVFFIRVPSAKVLLGSTISVSGL
jgi:hypothetical protein